jgi:hypothetical protein
MKSLVKKAEFKVKLNREDAADLRRLMELESQRRREIVGGGTLLRELAMPRVRELLAASSVAA